MGIEISGSNWIQNIKKKSGLKMEVLQSLEFMSLMSDEKQKNKIYSKMWQIEQSVSVWFA